VARIDADAALTCCAFTPNGSRVVAGDAGGAVHFLTVVGLDREEVQAAAPEVPPAPQPSPAQMAPAMFKEADRQHPWWQFWQSRGE